MSMSLRRSLVASVVVVSCLGLQAPAFAEEDLSQEVDQAINNFTSHQAGSRQKLNEVCAKVAKQKAFFGGGLNTELDSLARRCQEAKKTDKENPPSNAVIVTTPVPTTGGYVGPEPVGPPPPPPQFHIPGLGPEPPQPDNTLPRFCSVQEKIDYIQKVLNLRSLWWKYANDMRALALAQHLNNPAVTAAIQAADKVYFDMGDLIQKLYADPVQDCGGHASWTGGYLGGELAKNTGRVRSTESSALTGLVTNQFSDSGDPIGIGIVAGYNYRPWNNNIVVGTFASFDWLHQTINHNFAGGQFLGTTTHWIATVGAKGGYVVAPNLYVYGLTGVSWLNHDLNVNFATAASSNVTSPGFTLGLGGEYQPSSWRLFGHPVSVFLQYQHTWWSTANFNTPTSSPAFNYAFKRDDDTIKLGFNVYLSAPTPSPPTRGLITK